jgi:hypothetical protein
MRYHYDSTVDLPASLPCRLYLLAYDTTKQRFTARQQLGLVLSAAALTELYLNGQITNIDGTPSVSAPQAADPVLDPLLAQIAESKPRSWVRWVNRGERATRTAVQERLVTARLIQIEARRLFGLIPFDRVSVCDERLVQQLRDIVDRALAEEVPVNRVERADAALVALAAAGGLRAAVSWRRARGGRQRIAEFAAAAGPAVPALRKAVAARKSAGTG